MRVVAAAVVVGLAVPQLSYPGCHTSLLRSSGCPGLAASDFVSLAGLLLRCVLHPATTYGKDDVALAFSILHRRRFEQGMEMVSAGDKIMQRLRTGGCVCECGFDSRDDRGRISTSFFHLFLCSWVNHKRLLDHCASPKDIPKIEMNHASSCKIVKSARQGKLRIHDTAKDPP